MTRLLLLRGAIGAGKSTVAAQIQARVEGIKVIEIDEIKKQKHFTVHECKPEEDFPEAGREARRAMLAGYTAIVVEPLCDQQHIELVVKAAGLELGSQNILSVWLDCDFETSLKRKNEQSRSIICGQHKRYLSRFRMHGEKVIKTDDLPLEQVTEAVQRAFDLV